MLATRNHYLREMGIDIWVRRGTRPAADVEPREPAAPAEAAPAAESAGPPPEFHLCFATYGELSLVFSVPEDSAALPAPMRRFADDVARALGVTQPPALTALRWPLVKAPHIDQSEAAARAVVDERLASCGSIRVYFGRHAERLAGRDGGLVVEDMEAYLQEPLRKRELWKTLQSLRTDR